MTESELRTHLRSVPLEIDPLAEQRAWEAVRSAYEATTPRHQGHRWRGLTLAAACLAVLVTIALAGASAPREALGRLLRDAFGLTAAPHVRPTLGRLPGGGRILVNARGGPWIVRPDGSRRYLGRFSGGAWSPHSLYVIAWRGSELTALDLDGHRQWTLSAPGPVTAARWSPDGYRIAFLAAGSVEVVAGDGSGARVLRAGVSAVAPAWQPGSAVHRLTFVDRHGVVEQIDTDSGELLWRVKPTMPVRQLLWSADGSRLIMLAARGLTLLGPGGQRIAQARIASGQSFVSGALLASGQLAAIVHRAATQTDGIALLRATGRGLRRTPSISYAGLERLSGLDVSPTQEWLLAESPSADEWLFIRLTRPARLVAISRIAAKFAGPSATGPRFPELAGWQH